MKNRLLLCVKWASVNTRWLHHAWENDCVSFSENSDTLSPTCGAFLLMAMRDAWKSLFECFPKMQRRFTGSSPVFACVLANLRFGCGSRRLVAFRKRLGLFHPLKYVNCYVNACLYTGTFLALPHWGHWRRGVSKGGGSGITLV